MASAVPWWANSLLSTVLALVVAGLAVSFDRRKTVNQELIRKRIAVYEQVAPLLNDIYFYFLSFGEPTELTPPDIIDRKRKLDRLLKLMVLCSPNAFPGAIGISSARHSIRRRGNGTNRRR